MPPNASRKAAVLGLQARGPTTNTDVTKVLGNRVFEFRLLRELAVREWFESFTSQTSPEFCDVPASDLFVSNLRAAHGQFEIGLFEIATGKMTPVVLLVEQCSTVNRLTIVARMPRNAFSNHHTIEDGHVRSITVAKAMQKLILATMVPVTTKRECTPMGVEFHPHHRSILTQLYRMIGAWAAPTCKPTPCIGAIKDAMNAASDRAWNVTFCLVPALERCVEECFCLLGHSSTFQQLRTSRHDSDDDDDKDELPLSCRVADEKVWAIPFGFGVANAELAQLLGRATPFLAAYGGDATTHWIYAKIMVLYEKNETIREIYERQAWAASKSAAHAPPCDSDEEDDECIGRHPNPQPFVSSSAPLFSSEQGVNRSLEPEPLKEREGKRKMTPEATRVVKKKPQRDVDEDEEDDDELDDDDLDAVSDTSEEEDSDDEDEDKEDAPATESADSDVTTMDAAFPSAAAQTYRTEIHEHLVEFTNVAQFQLAGPERTALLAHARICADGHANAETSWAAAFRVVKQLTRLHGDAMAVQRQTDADAAKRVVMTADEAARLRRASWEAKEHAETTMPAIDRVAAALGAAQAEIAQLRSKAHDALTGVVDAAAPLYSQ